MRKVNHTQEYTFKKMDALMSPTKVCKGCNIEKFKDKFTDDFHRKDGKYPLCKDCCAKRQREYYKLHSHTFYLNNVRFRSKHSDIKRAWWIVRRAIDEGKLIRPLKCQRCGTSDSIIEAHHWRGYSDEHILDVQWLCRSCHRMADRKL